MPSILVETRSGWITSPEQILESVQDGVSAALKLPDWDREIRLVEYRPSHFLVPHRGDRFTLVTVAMFAGRSLEAKRALYSNIVARLESAGVPRSDVTIVLNEIGQENWGVAGGQPASEVNLGIKIDI